MKRPIFSLILAYALIAPAVFATLTPSGLGGNTLGLSCSNGQVPEWNGTGFTVCLDPAGGGTVTSVGLSTDSTTSAIFANTANAFTGSPVTAAGAFTVTFKTQVKNKFLGGPTTGADAAPTYRLLVGADLPLPGASALGGVFSKAAVSHQFLTSISSVDGSVGQAQPAFTDINGALAGAQLPTFTGDVTNSAAAMSIAAATVTGKVLTGFSSGAGTVTSADSILTAFNKVWGWIVALRTQSYVGMVPAPTDGTYTIDLYAAYPGTFNTLKVITDSGTTTMAVSINGTPVTGISAVSVSSIIATGTATAANTWVAGDKLSFTLSASSTPVNLAWTLSFTR